jgi:hypothetical protein
VRKDGGDESLAAFATTLAQTAFNPNPEPSVNKNGIPTEIWHQRLEIKWKFVVLVIIHTG